MNIEQLLARLKGIGVYIDEDRRLQDGTRVLILRCKMPAIPLGDQQGWHVLVIEPLQDSVERKEIEAVLRKLWHGSTPFFDDEINQAGHPIELIEHIGDE